MRLKFLVPAVLLVLALSLAAACGESSGGSQENAATGGAGETGGGTGEGSWLSAREAVELAKEALPADWAATARLVLVSRYSRYCPVESSPFDVEQDKGIGSDGRQAHWVVIFAQDETESTANVYYVENGQARLVKSDIAMFSPDDVFDLEGWVDSTGLQLRSSGPVGLELRTSDLFEDVDPELAAHPLLWLAETSFGHFDVYDAQTGAYIKSR